MLKLLLLLCSNFGPWWYSIPGFLFPGPRPPKVGAGGDPEAVGCAKFAPPCTVLDETSISSTWKEVHLIAQ